MVNKLNGNDLIYQTGNKKKDRTYDFQKFKTIRFFGRGIYKNNFSLDDSLEQQIILKDDIDILKNLSNQKNHSKKKKKQLRSQKCNCILNGRQKVLHAFESGIFSKRKQGERLTSISDCVARIARVAKVSHR